MKTGVGLILLLAAAANLRPEHLFDSVVIEAGLASAGILLSVLGVSRIVCRIRGTAWGDFKFYDGAWFWDVRGGSVRVSRLVDAKSARAMSRIVNGTRTETMVHVELASGNWTMRVNSEAEARRVIEFLEVASGLRQYVRSGHAVPEVGRFLSTDGGLAQATALRIQSPLEKLRLDPRMVVPIPTPMEVEGRSSWRNIALTASLGVGLFLLGLLGLPHLRKAIDHHHRYHLALTSPPNDIETLRDYLDRFPQGPDVQEISDLLDDRRFEIARGRAEQQKVPAALREYLSSSPSERHQQEARTLISGFYDEAIDHIRSLERNGAREHEFIKGLVGLLEYLRRQPMPIAKVSFQHECVVVPVAEGLKESERDFERGMRGADAVIDQLYRSRGTSVIDALPAFSEVQIRSREKVILNRFRESLGPILSQDLIELVRAEDGAMGDIQIRYRIQPTGTLRIYREVNETSLPADRSRKHGGAFSNSGDARTKGSIREYDVEWQVVLSPGASTPVIVYSSRSGAAKELNYRSSASDPSWAVYSVLMYSTFHDFANGLLEGAGLAPKSPPTYFRFSDTQ